MIVIKQQKASNVESKLLCWVSLSSKHSSKALTSEFQFADFSSEVSGTIKVGYSIKRYDANKICTIPFATNMGQKR